MIKVEELNGEAKNEALQDQKAREKIQGTEFERKIDDQGITDRSGDIKITSKSTLTQNENGTYKMTLRALSNPHNTLTFDKSGILTSNNLRLGDHFYKITQNAQSGDREIRLNSIEETKLQTTLKSEKETAEKNKAKEQTTESINKHNEAVKTIEAFVTSRRGTLKDYPKVTITLKDPPQPTTPYQTLKEDEKAYTPTLTLYDGERNYTLPSTLNFDKDGKPILTDDEFKMNILGKERTYTYNPNKKAITEKDPEKTKTTQDRETVIRNLLTTGHGNAGSFLQAGNLKDGNDSYKVGLKKGTSGQPTLTGPLQDGSYMTQYTISKFKDNSFNNNQKDTGESATLSLKFKPTLDLTSGNVIGLTLSDTVATSDTRVIVDTYPITIDGQSILFKLTPLDNNNYQIEVAGKGINIEAKTKYDSVAYQKQNVLDTSTKKTDSLITLTGKKGTNITDIIKFSPKELNNESPLITPSLDISSIARDIAKSQYTDSIATLTANGWPEIRIKNELGNVLKTMKKEDMTAQTFDGKLGLDGMVYYLIDYNGKSLKIKENTIFKNKLDIMDNIIKDSITNATNHITEFTGLQKTWNSKIEFSNTDSIQFGNEALLSFKATTPEDITLMYKKELEPGKYSLPSHKDVNILEKDIGTFDHIIKNFTLNGNDGNPLHTFQVQFDKDGNFKGAREVDTNNEKIKNQNRTENRKYKYFIPTGEKPDNDQENKTVFRQLILRVDENKLALDGEKQHQEIKEKQ